MEADHACMKNKRLERESSDLHFLGLPMPIDGLAIKQEVKATELVDHCPIVIEASASLSGGRQGADKAQFSMIEIGQISLCVGRTTPVDLLLGPCDAFHAQVCYAGSAMVCSGQQQINVASRQAIVMPNGGCQLVLEHYAGIATLLDGRRLQRTLRVMAGSDRSVVQLEPRLLANGDGRDASASILMSLFSHIGEVVQENPYLADGLGLDDQLYRTFALVLLDHDVAFKRFAAPWSGSRLWSSTLDDLVDYIRSHLHESITLTDLEAQSNYTGRHLQSLFRDKFGCTPMQFVRKQRLNAAMERMREARAGDTVARIARDCGYRHVSNFSTDFYKAFGVNPSVVLRASRAGGGG